MQQKHYTDCGCPGGYGVRGFVPAIHGNDVDQCYHAHSVNYHYGNLVRKNDRNLPLYFHSTNPFATMTNKEWGNIGNNYLKGLFALAFQGFFMMVCVGIYAVLVNAMTISSDLHAAMFSVAAYTVILAFSLFKTGSLSKSIFNAH